MNELSYILWMFACASIGIIIAQLSTTGKQLLLRLALFYIAVIALFCIFEPRGKPVSPPAPSGHTWTIHLAPASPDSLPGFTDPRPLPRIEGKYQLGHVTDLAGHTYPLACDSPDSNRWLWRDHTGAWQEIDPHWDFDLGPRP